MSEYVTVESEATPDPDVIELTVNQKLTTEEEEIYDDFAAGEEGSALAQSLFYGVSGILALTIRPHTLLITRDAEIPWEQIIDDVRDALRDFFL